MRYAYFSMMYYILKSRQAFFNNSSSYLLLVFVLLFSSSLFAGNLQIPEHIDASDELRSYFEKSYRFSHVDMDSCKYYSELLISKSKEENNRWAQIAGESMYGAYLINTHQLEEAQELVNRTLEKAKELNEPFLLSIAHNIRGIYAHAINDSEAMINDFLNALQNAEASGNLNRVGIMATNLGYVHLIDENLDEAEEYFLMAKLMSDSTNNVRLEASVAGSLGQLYAQQGQIHRAIQNYKEALKLSKESGDVYNQAYTHLVLGKLYLDQDIYDGAESSLKKSIGIFEDMGNVERRIQAYLNLIRTYNKSGKHNSAIKYADRASSLLNDYESSDFKMQYYEVLSDAHAGLGDYKTAYTNYKEHKAWADSVYTADKAAKVLELDTKHKLEKKDLNIQLLNEKQAESEAQLRQRNLINILALLLILVISAALYSTWRGYQSKTSYSDNLEQEVQKRTEDLESINHRLLNSNQELERFAYITSHDLKEPLRNINSFTTLAELSLNRVDLEQARENLKMVKSSSKQMYDLINAVLDYSKLRNEVENQNIELNQIFEDVQTSLAHIINEKKASVITNGLPTIVGNKFQYFQLFQNLIENGVKYNESESPLVEISYEETDSTLELIFKDNGIGIDSEYHEQIFTMFKRLHTKSEYFGTGLGLATVKKIVNNLGGEISLDSVIGEGSSFTVSIPKIVQISESEAEQTPIPVLSEIA